VWVFPRVSFSRETVLRAYRYTGALGPRGGGRYAADVNDDGNVNVLDVVRIVNVALGRS
jgi:hypothetical protein